MDCIPAQGSKCARLVGVTMVLQCCMLALHPFRSHHVALEQRKGLVAMLTNTSSLVDESAVLVDESGLDPSSLENGGVGTTPLPIAPSPVLNGTTLPLGQVVQNVDFDLEIKTLVCFKQMILDKFNFSPESSIWKYPHPSSSALVEDFKGRGRGCVLWHRVTFAGSCSQWEVPTPSKECSACFMSFRGTWRMSPAPATPLTVGTTWGFHPEATCKCSDVEKTWSRCGMLKSFGGLHLGVIGDSMGRQLFQRFVSFFRAPRGPVTDAYFAGDFAAYEVNEKEDCLSLPSGPACKKLAKPKIRMSFFLEKGVKARDLKHLDSLSKKRKLDAIAVMNGYWFSRSNVDHVAEKLRTSTVIPRIPTFLLSMSPQVNKISLFGLDYFRELNLASKAKAASTSKNLYVVDFQEVAKMAHNMTWVNGEDRTHYMCGGYPTFEAHRPWKQIKAWRGALDAYNCDDPVNGALVQAILVGLSKLRSNPA